MAELITIDIAPRVKQQLLSRAEEFRKFRLQCVKYLGDHGRLEDKFTVNEHDRKIGFVSEHVLAQHLPCLYSDCILSVRLWYEQFDMRRIARIVRGNSGDPDDLALVHEYFYDSWDIDVDTVNGRFRCDVKTAATAYDPRNDWDFLYPVSQAKQNKDLVILAYYRCTKRDDPDTLAHIVLAGATTMDVIRECPRVGAGERTRKNTYSNVDNYETELEHHYRPVPEYLCHRPE